MNELRPLTVGLLIASAACGNPPPPGPDAAPSPGEPQAAEPADVSDEPDLFERIDDLIVAEEVLLGLSERLRSLQRDLLDLRLPGADSRGFFADRVVVQGVRSLGEAATTDQGVRVSSRTVQLDPEPQERAAAELNLFGAALDRFEHLEVASLHATDGRFVDEAETRMATAVHAVLRGPADDGIALFDAYLELEWQRGPMPPRDPTKAPVEPDWRIESWIVRSAEWSARPRPMFEEALDRFLPDPARLAAARRSIHEEYVVASILEPRTFVRPTPHFEPASHDRHPSVSVADVNGDGLDDLYLTARWGRNQLFLGRPDGTFREDAATWGLDLEDHTGAALFVDLDNDGDLDAVLGRTLARSVLLFQQDGRFVDASASVETPLPGAVSSIAAADIDGDGLLDLYFSTYALHSGLVDDEALPPELRAEQARLLAGAHPIHDQVGPPNVLLRNRGAGRFERDFGVPPVFRHTYQSTFADVDQDGDADLYVVNDYAENVLLENDGTGSFRDVSTQAGATDLGFGMGATWGDYDRDGREDLYVSNMFSNAGRRITAALPGIDPRFAKMARGNTLLRNLGGRLEVASGPAPALEVERTGWSWGGQFVDVDSDGWLDIAVLNGYFTAPDRVAQPVDI